MCRLEELLAEACILSESLLFKLFLPHIKHRLAHLFLHELLGDDPLVFGLDTLSSIGINLLVTVALISQLPVHRHVYAIHLVETCLHSAHILPLLSEVSHALVLGLLDLSLATS